MLSRNLREQLAHLGKDTILATKSSKLETMTTFLTLMMSRECHPNKFPLTMERTHWSKPKNIASDKDCKKGISNKSENS